MNLAIIENYKIRNAQQLLNTSCLCAVISNLIQRRKKEKRHDSFLFFFFVVVACFHYYVKFPSIHSVDYSIPIIKCCVKCAFLLTFVCVFFCVLLFAQTPS